MKQEQWKPRRRVEREYESILISLWEKVKGHIRADVLTASEFVKKYAEQAAMRMITGLYFEGARTWREAARESGKTRLMYAALQKEMQGPVGRRVRELVRENAELISSFPQNVARRVASAAAAQQRAGGRAKEIRGWLSGVVRSRAQLIARTEVSKASSALTQARSEELGLDWYEWQTSQDERVRFSHRKMQGVLVRFNDPPSPEALANEPKPPQPYNAGGIWNCRCYPAPVVRLENLSWPRRVFYGGKVQYMTLARFRLLNQKRRAA